MNRRSFIPLFGTALVGVSCLSLNDDVKDQAYRTTKILPNRLKKGDTIGIAASAGPIRSKKEVANFQRELELLGYKTKLGKNIYGQEGYFSADDVSRAEEFMELIQDDEVDAIFFIRGGWGCARLLELLDFEQIRMNPKIIMGFSDITTLLNAISCKTGIITFHGPGGNSTWNDYSITYIKNLLEKGEKILYQNSSTDLVIKTYKSGNAIGELYGGNLSVISGLIGSKYLPDWKGKILFLEDVGEEPYRIDRMLTHLRLSGVFDKLNGIVLGNFRKCTPDEPNRSFTLEEVFEQHFSVSSIPVFYGSQIGHTRNKFTVPIGSRVEINAGLGTIQLLDVVVN
ncbi:MAG: LD-carboxypeptidase [Crocinitomicaceae bacterium]|nr:LD-carboxypeptidase [Crocinitomicaceae bacterium]